MVMYDLYLYSMKVILAVTICELVAVYIISYFTEDTVKQAIGKFFATVVIFFVAFFATQGQWTELKNQVDLFLENENKCAELLKSSNDSINNSATSIENTDNVIE